MNQQRNFNLNQSGHSDSSLTSSRSRQKCIAALTLVAFIVLLVLNQDNGKNSEVLRQEPYDKRDAKTASDAVVNNGDVMEDDEVDERDSATASTTSSAAPDPEPSIREDQGEDNLNDKHPWWWIGLSDILVNKDVDFVTSTLADYAENKIAYSSPSEFIIACEANQLPDKRCDFLGGPAEKFSLMPAHVMKVLRHLGMKESSKVLEVGVGLGRNAKSLIDFLDRDKYCGIEPNGDMLAVGVAHLIGKKNMEEKRPTFSTNSNFDFGVFFRSEETENEIEEHHLFDVVTSRSVWTHTSKIQIEQYLAFFAKHTTPAAFLATSVIEVTEDCSKDYNGAEWLGKSHDSNNGGIAVHCMPWLREACAKEGLVVKSLAEEAPDLVEGHAWDDLGQPWIVVRHGPTPDRDHVKK